MKKILVLLLQGLIVVFLWIGFEVVAIMYVFILITVFSIKVFFFSKNKKIVEK